MQAQQRRKQDAEAQPSLVIVQTRETQFDAPLYARIHQGGLMALRVIYTTPASPGSAQDPELGFAPQWDHLRHGAYPHHYLKGHDAWSMWTLSRQLRHQKPSLVLICGYFPRYLLLLALLLRCQGQRIGLRSDNTLRHTSFQGWQGCLRRKVIGWIQAMFDSWHPVGEQAHAYLREVSGLRRPSYRFAYAVDNDWFAQQCEQALPSRSQFLRERGWPEDAFVVLGIMKWNGREDPLTLVQAFQRLREHCRRARLVLVGDGPLRQRVIQASAPMGDDVHCPGYSPYSRLPSWYAMADVFVHPAPDEPWGVSVNEAMACGLPVIAAAGVGAGAEMIHPGRNGQRFANGDVLELADCLNAMATAAVDARQSMQQACRDTADDWHYRDSMTSLAQAVQDT